MPSILFYLFAALMVAGGMMVVLMRNPVSSALSMVLSFIGLAGLFIGLNAYFVGILQILVYAGAIMVLFIFIIMLMDVKIEEKGSLKPAAVAAGVAIPLILLMQLMGVLSSIENSPSAPEINHVAALAQTNDDGSLTYKEGTMINKRLKAERLPDTHLIGYKLFTDYNFPLQVIAVLLLVATVGCVTLSKKSTPKAVNKKQMTQQKRIPKVAIAPPEKTKEEHKKEAPSEQSKIAETKEANLPESQKPTEEAKAPQTKPSDTTNEANGNRGMIYAERPDDADDLKIISGIGPVIEKKLNGFGIYTYKQVADWSEENITEFDGLLSFKGRINRDDWLTQAAELYAQKSA